MESLLLRALESTLRQWLKTFSRDQFQLRGRSVQLSNLDVHGEVLHAAIGLPPTVEVTEARVAKLELKIPSLSNVNREPIVVAIDKLDLILTETPHGHASASPKTPDTTSFSKSSSYGYADKLADGMTMHVTTVNLMLETRGGKISTDGGAVCKPPLASLTMRNLILYTTNEHWKVVPLNQARNFNSHMKSIYVFKKLEWESLSVDLLPHPDMFSDERFLKMRRSNTRDKDDATRLFFNGERFLDSISGSANITMYRSEHNLNLGLEVQLHIPDILVPALTEPGLRALLRFMIGVYVCINRGDVGVRSSKLEPSRKSTIGVIVDHTCLCIKDVDYQLEFQLQSLQYLRAISADGACMRTLTRITIGCLNLRDAFSQPSSTLLQPSMRISGSNSSSYVPSFASDKLWPKINPLEKSYLLPETTETPMVCVYSVRTVPAPAPPNLASQTVVSCQPLKGTEFVPQVIKLLFLMLTLQHGLSSSLYMSSHQRISLPRQTDKQTPILLLQEIIHYLTAYVRINFQEETCLRMASILSDGINLESGLVLPERSLNAVHFNLNEFDLTVPLNAAMLDEDYTEDASGFTGIRLRVEGFMVAHSPSLSFKLLNLEKDAACFSMWKGQPVDTSHQRWVMRAARLSIALETSGCDDTSHYENAGYRAVGLWRCVEMNELYLEAAMATADGAPLIEVFPPGGIVRLGIACEHCLTNTSSEQFLFVLKMYSYLGILSDMLLRELKLVTLRKESSKRQASFRSFKRVESLRDIAEMVPSDVAVYLSLKTLEFKLLESVPEEIAVEGPPLVLISSRNIDLTATHRTLAAAAVITSNLCWRDIRIDCVEADICSPGAHETHYGSPPTHLSGFRDTVDFSTVGASLNSSSGDSSGACGDLLMRPVPLKLSPRAGRSSLFRRGLPVMRGVLWIGMEKGSMAPIDCGEVIGVQRLPFLDIDVKSVISFKTEDAACHSLRVRAKVGGVRLGGGMTYNESLLHRFGVFDAEGCPGPEVEKVIKSLSKSSIAYLFRSDIGGGRNGDEGMNTKKQAHIWDVGLLDDIEIEIHLLDWLFALGGAETVSEVKNSHVSHGVSASLGDDCYHCTFRGLNLKAQGSKEAGTESAARQGMRYSPVRSLVLQIEGLQALKSPFTSNHSVGDSSDGALFSNSTEDLARGGTDLNPSNNGQIGECEVGNIDGVDDVALIENSIAGRIDSLHPGSFYATAPSVTSMNGLDFEIQLEGPDQDDGVQSGLAGWAVKVFKVAVREPVEFEASRREVDFMVNLFKSEIESASRIAAGGLKLLQLHRTIGLSSTDKLSQFGSGGLDRLLSPDEVKVQQFIDGCASLIPSVRKSFKRESTLARLKTSISETETLCLQLHQRLSIRTDSVLATELKALATLINSSQALLEHLKYEL